MRVGDVVAGRFLLQRLVGEGGSSKVYQAFDRAENRTIALKVLSVKSEFEDQRFRSEARILSDLTHPKIVSYVAHGETAAFESFIAMQWLEGETLAERLSREPLGVAESLSVIRQTAEALSEAHDRGLVHRDLKPSNLFLVDRDPAQVKVLDFGIAKFLHETGERTGTGAFLGTVGYMAPEQATAARDADSRADVFALGCVLFECLTGRPAFVARHAVALLAKVLSEPAPRLSELSPGVSPGLDALVARMLEKSPEARPADAASLIRELDALADDENGPYSAPPVSVATALTGFERRVVSVALVHAPGGELSGLAEAQTIAGRYGAEATLLQTGALLLLLSGRGTAVDRAAQAAACTLAVRKALPRARIVLSTGWADASSRAPVGPVIDRAAALLHGIRARPTDPGGVVVDTTTARLLASRFEIESGIATSLLVSELTGDEPPPRLLGRATPCVGREKELSFLRSVLADTIADRTPRAVLVTADAGVGKSRLAREFTSSAIADGRRVLLAKSDSTGAGAAFLLARQLVRGASRIPESATAKEVVEAFVARLSPRLGEKNALHTAEFLCELLDVPVTAEPNSVLSAARGDARLMSEWMRRSFDEWLSVEAADPLVIVLEDLHWGDAPTVAYLGDALWRRDLPIFVLALARREVKDVFPKLWPGAQLEEVGLAGLGRRAAEELVRSVLPDADEETTLRIVGRANGNAFYLEELIRAVAEGRGDTLPETVVAMAHAGLERLDPALRRILRAASVFGERFTAVGVGALVADPKAARAALETLEEREVVSRVRGDGTSDDSTYAFRHALLRDAAYATLTDEDRRTVHRLAADFLEATGNADPVVMADHLESGGAEDRAVPYLVRAAERAYAAGIPADTRRLSARGVDHARGESLGALLLLDGASALLQGDYRTATTQLRAAKPLLDPATDRWFLGIATLAYASTVAGAPAAAVEFVESILALPQLPIKNPLCAFGIARGVLTLSFAGDRKRALALVDRVDLEAARNPDLNPSSEGWLHLARGFSFMGGVRTLPDAVQRARVTVDLFEEAKDNLAIPSALCWLGAVRGCVGDYRGAADVQREAISRSEAGGNLISPSLMKPLLEIARAICGEPESALAELEKPSGHGNPLGESVLLWARAHVLYLLGRFAESEAVARGAVGTRIPISAHAASATLARVLFHRARYDESLEVATACVERNLRDPFFLSADATLVRAECLYSLGRTGDARDAIREARKAVLETARALPESDRETYLGAVRSNARTLELATEWLRHD